MLGPDPAAADPGRQRDHPGPGFREGPFSTETELRELVDLAEASAVIESGEREMIHSVFEFGDTIAREVMVPRGDVVYIERYKNLRQTLSLFLRSGFSRVPVIGENLDDIVGFAYLKDVVRRDFEAPEVEFTQRVDEVMRPALYVPESKQVDALLLGDAGHAPAHRGRRRRVRRHRRPGHHRGPAGGDRRRDHRRVRRRPGRGRPLADGSVRVPSRYPIDDLDELFGFEVEDEDVDSVGGLMAKHLGRVPIPGSHVEAHGLRFVAEEATGRRNRIESVLETGVPGPKETVREWLRATFRRGQEAGPSGEGGQGPDGRRRGRAVRDLDGRTYAAATVALPSLAVSALGACIAMAISSASRGLEAVVVMGVESLADSDAAALREFAGDDVVVHLL